jgi:hypothetical protein
MINQKRDWHFVDVNLFLILFGGKIMLYISRCYQGDKYGVVDSDDDVEEFVSTQEILSYVKDLHLDIKGVKITSDGFVNIEAYPYETNVKCTKLKILYGINIVTRGDSIGLIEVPENANVDKPIRLSNYGHIIEDYALKPFTHAGKPVVLILDDSLKFTARAFTKLATVARTCYIFDIMGVTDTDIIESVYMRCLNRFAKEDYNVSDYGIIDSVSRSDYYRAWNFIRNYSSVNHDGKSRINFKFKDVNETAGLVEKYFHKSFTYLANLREFEFKTQPDRYDFSYAFTITKNLYYIHNSFKFIQENFDIYTINLPRLEGYLMLFGLDNVVYNYYKSLMTHLDEFCKRRLKE